MDERILYAQDDGRVVIIIPASNSGLTIDEIAEKDVPEGKTFEIVDVSDVPSDRLFRNAWEHDTTASTMKVKVNMTKAKAIAHDFRRGRRSSEFMSVDGDNQYSALTAEGEVLRQPIRDRYALMQTNIDAAKTPAAIKKALGL